MHKLTCDTGPLDNLQVFEAGNDLTLDTNDGKRHISMTGGDSMRGDSLPEGDSNAVLYALSEISFVNPGKGYVYP
jgi:hypothetical protein